MVKKNLSTPENREFWRGIEETARQVEHWPKWAGGEGKEPVCCPQCNRPLAPIREVRIKIIGRDAYICMPLETYRKLKTKLLKVLNETA